MDRRRTIAVKNNLAYFIASAATSPQRAQCFLTSYRQVPSLAISRNITAYELNEAEDRARAAGCDAYMAKPISPRQLLAKVREYLPSPAPTR
jgi:CheY-like chemotaxis protein